MLVKEVMNKKVVIAFPETKVNEIARLMSKYGIGSVVIINEKGRILGIVTERDVMKIVAEARDPRGIQANEIMTTGVITIDESRTVEEATEVMVENRIKKLPVVKKNQLRGIITATDLIIANTKLIKEMSHLVKSKKVEKEDFASLYIWSD